MRHRAYVQIALCIGITACAAPKKPDTVWENYDVRHPVPVYSKVPDGYARQYDYIDNDSYYSAPNCQGITVGPGCVGGE